MVSPGIETGSGGQWARAPSAHTTGGAHGVCRDRPTPTHAAWSMALGQPNTTGVGLWLAWPCLLATRARRVCVNIEGVEEWSQRRRDFLRFDCAHLDKPQHVIDIESNHPTWGWKSG